MRRAGAAVCLVLGLGMVSGCSPAHLTLVAVTNGEDGRPVAVLQPCDDGGEDIMGMRLGSWPSGASRVEMDGAGTGGADEDRASVDDGGWETPRGTTHRGRAVIPVLSPPDSWLVEGGGARELLPGRTYSLSFYSYDGVYYGDGYFTTQDLASLRPGQVWAAGRAMSVDDFADHVGEVC
ncbi:hypothetical protein [Streptomyces sp. CO7]